MRSLLASVILVSSATFGQYDNVQTYAGNGTAGFVNGGALASQFNAPYGICCDPVSNDLYVADLQNNVIRRIHDGQVSTFVGNGVAGDIDAQGTNARFSSPSGVYFKDGFLYICDNLNNKIKRADSDGNVVTIAGSGASGFQDGNASQAKFYQPKSLVVDDDGVVFIADYENHRIRKLENGLVSTYAGSGSAGDGTGPALSAALHRPRDLCLAADGTLYFVDLMNHRVKKVTTDGTVELVAGSGVSGSNDGSGASASFNIPVGIDWLDANSMVVLDAVDPLVRRVTTSGMVSTIAGSGINGYYDGPSDQARFSLIQDVCVDSDQNIYVSDRDNNVIRVLGKSGDVFASIAERRFTEALSLHPNPASTNLWIDRSALNGPIDRLVVVDAAGHIVLDYAQVVGAQVASERLMLPVDKLTSGSYILSIWCEGRRFGASFIKE